MQPQDPDRPDRGAADPPEEPRKPSLLRLFGIFLRIGATGFGGPATLISMLQDHFVEREKAVTPQEFAEAVAVGQVLPGPIAIDAGVYIGYRLRGWLGATAASVGMILPPFLLMLGLTPLYLHYGVVPQVQGFFEGVRPAVVAVIVAAVWRLGKRSVQSVGPAVIAVVVLAAAVAGGDPILLVLLAAALGILLCPAAKEAKP